MCIYIYIYIHIYIYIYIYIELERGSPLAWCCWARLSRVRHTFAGASSWLGCFIICLASGTFRSGRLPNKKSVVKRLTLGAWHTVLIPSRVLTTRFHGIVAARSRHGSPVPCRPASDSKRSPARGCTEMVQIDYYYYYYYDY